MQREQIKEAKKDDGREMDERLERVDQQLAVIELHIKGLAKSEKIGESEFIRERRRRTARELVVSRVGVVVLLLLLVFMIKWEIMKLYDRELY